MAEALHTLAYFDFDGRAALAAVVAASPYRNAAQAVAALTVFSHPRTVAQIPNGALFPCVRSLGRHDRRTLDFERKVGLDDNAVPKATFAWCNDWLGFSRDLQLNHVYSRRADPAAFTALGNLCVGPSFLAKLTDDDPEIMALLQWRSLDLYGWRPDDIAPPSKPAAYDKLIWTDPLPVVADLRSRFAQANDPQF